MIPRGGDLKEKALLYSLRSCGGFSFHELMKAGAFNAREKKTLRCLRHRRAFSFVGVAGFEPATLWSQTRCANRAALHPASSSVAFFDLRSFSEGGGEGGLFKVPQI